MRGTLHSIQDAIMTLNLFKERCLKIHVLFGIHVLNDIASIASAEAGGN
jgi:hypothetical protein